MPFLPFDSSTRNLKFSVASADITLTILIPSLQRFDLGWLLTCDRQSPVVDQLVPVNFNPCLYQSHSRFWKVTFQYLSIINRDNRIEFAVLNVNMWTIVFSIVKVEHKPDDTIEGGYYRHVVLATGKPCPL